MSKQPPPTPTASAIGPCPTIVQTSRTPQHWKFTQYLRSTRPPPLDEIKSQGVTAVKRFGVRKDGQLKDTNTFVFTFNTPVLPTTIKIAFLRVNVAASSANSWLVVLGLTAL